jgi:hypothetical protein
LSTSTNLEFKFVESTNFFSTNFIDKFAIDIFCIRQNWCFPYETPHKLISYAKKDVRTRKISSFLLEKFFKRIFLDRRYTLKHRSILMNTNYRRKSITYISLFRTRLSQTLKVAMRDKFFFYNLSVCSILGRLTTGITRK